MIGNLGRSLDEGVFKAFYFMGSALVRLLYPIRVEGHFSFLWKRPVILAPNHCSFLDPLILQAAFPRRITYLMTDAYYGIPLLNWFFRRMNCIPLKTEGSQLAAMRLGIETLKSTGLVSIFPEGKRSPDGSLGRGFPGVATLAARTGALVVPVAILGTHRALPKGARFLRPAKIRVRFGPPIDFGGNHRWKTREMTQVIMDSIRDLLPPDFVSPKPTR